MVPRANQLTESDIKEEVIEDKEFDYDSFCLHTQKIVETSLQENEDLYRQIRDAICF